MAIPTLAVRSRTPPTPDRSVPTLRETLRYFVRLAILVRDHWAGITKSVTLSIIIGVFGMVAPYISKILIDDAYPARDISLMHVLVICLFVLSLTSAWMNAVQGYFGQIVMARMGNATGLMFFNHLQHLRASFFDSHQVGEVLSRFSDVRSALATITSVFQTVLMNGVYLLLVPPFLILLNWKLAVLAIIVMPVTTVTTTLSSRYVRRYFKMNAQAGAALGAYQYEAFSHIRTLKAMAMEPYVYRRVASETHNVLETSLRAGRVQSVVGFVNGSIRAAGTGAFSWYAWTLVLNQQLTLGSFVAFTSYLGYLTSPVAQIAALFGSIQQASVSLGRMFEYLDLPVEQDPSLSYEPTPPRDWHLYGDLVFRGVTFGYEPSRPVVVDAELTIKQGTVTAIVGASGAGKSTLLRMIPRLVDPDRGTLSIGGNDLGAIALADLRRHIAVVWQEQSMMRGTVLDNLVPDGFDTSPSAITEALEACQLSETIAQLPDGLNTPVAEWGTTLSGGQRQRIAIARALISARPILLLDEATANIDVETEDALLSSVFARYRSKTIVMVTHRIAAASRADHVCVMEAGRVTAAGTPAELAMRDPGYRAMLSAAGILEIPRASA